MNSNQSLCGSLEEISLDLTHLHPEFDTYNQLDTMQILEYSKTTILSPIKQQPEPLFSIKINHEEGQTLKINSSRTSGVINEIMGKERNHAMLHCFNLVL
jgi:hypothetical protein